MQIAYELSSDGKCDGNCVPLPKMGKDLLARGEKYRGAFMKGSMALESNSPFLKICLLLGRLLVKAGGTAKVKTLPCYCCGVTTAKLVASQPEK
jgi:hypothetical protein